MTVVTDVRGEPAGKDDGLVARPAGRRSSVEAVGLLVGILGVLVLLAATIGAAPPG